MSSTSSVTNYMMMNQTQGLSSSSVRTEEETKLMQQKNSNQGIVTILGDTCTRASSSSASSPLRRTLSADMSSKKWLPHNNIANSSFSSEEEYEERKEEEEFDTDEAERERLEIWSSIQRNKKEEQEKSPSSAFDTWSSIMNLKGNNEISKSLPLTPYVPPLVKRSKSSLSEKSLEICTESLGSETGSDANLFFSSSSSSSSYPPSESEDNNKDTQQQQQQGAYEAEQEEEWYNYNYNNHHAITNKKSSSPPRSFPPPLPSLSLQSNSKKGSSLHMRPHRDNGRLVLEAVSLPSQNNFNARRQDGRLVLTYTNDASDEDEEDLAEENYVDGEECVEELEEEEEFEGFEEDEGDCYYESEYDEEEVDDVESVVMEKTTPLLSSVVNSSSVQRLALMMNNKQIGLGNRNPNWSEKFNKGVNLEDVSVVEMEASAVAQSLPQRVARLIPSSASASASFNFNANEYYCKTKPTTSESDDKVHNPLAYHRQNNNYSVPHKNNNFGSSKVIFSGDMNQVVSNDQQQLLVLRGKNGDYLVHNLKSCKDSRRPFLFWEPYCIATS